MPASAGNHLSDQSSPYLLAHAENPVEWYPWGPAALERARAEDRPIFLSIGYHTCHWCHVMERESFTDPTIAALMNRHFVNIKVDREERPDLDEVYMTATQLLSGQGGWPNSLFLTPSLAPFFAGTYFPSTDRRGMPGFPTVLRSLADAWSERREDVETQAADVADALRRALEERDLSGAELLAAGDHMAAAALDQLAGAFDSVWGGFGGAPKFPTPSRLVLLRELASERPRAEEMLSKTLDGMARGGLFDQLGGGFHRYATDREWRVPHFEKMLYDNGLLLDLYSRRAAAGDRQATRVVESTVGWLTGELRDPESGALWSALDADSEGREGAFYTWTRDELRAILGDEDFGFLAPLLGFDGPPFFEGDGYVLHLPAPLADHAARRRMEEEELAAEIERAVAPLRGARAQRERPATDDKVLVDWNGMAIAGLATAGLLLGRTSWLAVAEDAARFVTGTLREKGELRHSWRAGRPGPRAFLSDYVWAIHGLLALAEARAEGDWLAAAIELADEQERRLAAPAGGYFTAGADDDLLARSRDVFDGAIPGANAVAAWNLVELARRTDEGRWVDRARAQLEAFGGLVGHHPGAGDSLVVAALRFRRLQGRAGASGPGGALAGLEQEARGALTASLELVRAEEEGGRSLRLHLRPAEGWRIAGPSGSGPPAVSADGVELGAVRWPCDVEDGLRAEVELDLRVSAEEGGVVRVHFAACDRSRCLPPTRVELPIPG